MILMLLSQLEKLMINVLVEITFEANGEEIWFHRTMELPFQPAVGTEFNFELVGHSEDMKYRRYATFVVDGVCWEEIPGILHIWLSPHEDEEEELTHTCFNPLTWKAGEKELWRW